MQQSDILEMDIATWPVRLMGCIREITKVGFHIFGR